MHRFAATFDARTHARLRWAVTALLVFNFGACLAKGANGPDDPVLRDSRVRGFGEIAFHIDRDGSELSPTEMCALLATTQAQRNRGLMQVTDLRGYRGMIFRFPEDTQASFFMRNTPMPLSIAWFASDGRFISAADMEPCDNRDDCPLYAATAPYRYALEVPKGQLAEVGAGPGAKLVLDATCPVASAS